MNGVRAAFGLDETGMRQAVQLLKEWLKHQTHLPHEIEDSRLERWIIRCKNRLERTKTSVDTYYSLKTAMPDIMLERDPSSQWFQKVVNVAFVCPISKLTEDYCRVTVLGCLDPDPSSIVILDILKLCFMVQEIRMCEDYCLSDIYIMDYKNFTVGHITKVTLPVLKKMEVCAMKGFNLRIKEIHLVNMPPFADAMLSLLKMVLKPKLISRIHVHTKGFQSLHQKISPKILPSEYGGENGSLMDHWSAWLKKLLSYRDWFLEQDKMKSDESKRTGKTFNSGELFGFDGSFRQLNID